MNNLNNIGYDYLGKLTKSTYQKNNFDNNIKQKILGYVSKEKNKDNQKNLEYYNNIKKIHNKKNNNNKNNRINNENIDFDSGFNIGLKINSFVDNTKVKKNKKNINNINKNNIKNKLKLNNISNNYYSHRNTFSNKLSNMIDIKKSNKNILNKNYKDCIINNNNHNNQTINQIIKDFKIKIKKTIKEKELKINSAEISPNKNLDTYLSMQQISKEKGKTKNNLIEISQENLSKIKQPKKSENINDNKNNQKNKKNKFIKHKIEITKMKNSNNNNNNNIIKEELIQNNNNNNNEILQDPQYVNEYTVDILESLLIDENNFYNKKKYIDPFYLEKEESELTPEMRTVAVDWLVLVHHKIFKFQENTLFLAIQLFDRYLSKVIINTEKAELLLLSAFMLASKHNEIDYVNMQEGLQLIKKKFTKEEIINMEYEILNIINFEVLAPTMCDFFQVFANFLNLNKKKINEGLYLLNIVLVDFHMLEYPNFFLAFAVINLITKKNNNDLLLTIKKIIKKNNLNEFYDIINFDDDKQNQNKEILYKRIKILYNTFLDTKYKNIQEKFSEDNYDCVSKSHII